MASNKIQIELAVTKTGTGIEQVKNDLRTLESQIKRFTETFELFERVAGAAFGGWAVIQSLENLGGEVLDAGVKMQSLFQAFKTSEGGSDRAARAFAFVREESQRLGLGLESAARGYLKVSAASMGTSLAGDETRKIFTAMAEAGTALNLTSEDIEGALLAVGQMMSKGKVQAEELRGQIGERIPGAFQLAADAMGMTTAELDKFMSDGKLITDDFLPRWADAMHSRFAKPAIDASTSMQASLNRLSTAWTDLKSNIFDAVEQFGAASRAMAALTLTMQAFTPQKAPVKGSAWPGAGAPDQKSIVEGISGSLSQVTVGMKPEEVEYWIQYTEELKKAGSALKSIRTPQQQYGDELEQADKWLRNGVITLPAYNALVSDARKKLESGSKSHAKSTEELIKANMELESTRSKARLADIARESSDIEQSYKDGNTDAVTYYTELKRLATDSADERISQLEREKAAKGSLLAAEASSPGANRAALQASYQASIQQLDSEIAAQRDELSKSLRSLDEEYKKASGERLDAEVSTLQTLTQQEGLTADQRRRINQQYLEARAQQIDQEAEELRKKGVDAVTVDKWKTAQIKAEQEKLVQYNLAQLQRMLTDESTTAEEREKIWQQMRERIEAGEVNTWDAFKLGWQDTAEHFNKTAQDMMDAGNMAATGIRDALKYSFVGIVKGDFDDLDDFVDSFANSMIDKWSEMLANMLLDWTNFKNLMEGSSDSSDSIWGSLGNLFSGLFSGGSSSSTAVVSSTSSSSSNGWAIVAHSGGTVGSSAFQSRMVVPSVFAHAPRLHSGLAADEFPAILQAGEEVRSRSQVAADRKASGVNMQVNIHEAPGTKASVEQDDSGNLNVVIERIEQGITSRMSRGTGLSSYFDSRYTRRR